MSRGGHPDEANPPWTRERKRKRREGKRASKVAGQRKRMPPRPAALTTSTAWRREGGGQQLGKQTNQRMERHQPAYRLRPEAARRMRGSWSDTSGCEAAHAAATAPPTLALNGLGDVSVNTEDQRREDTKWLRVEQYLSACERASALRPGGCGRAEAARATARLDTPGSRAALPALTSASTNSSVVEGGQQPGRQTNPRIGRRRSGCGLMPGWRTGKCERAGAAQATAGLNTPAVAPHCLY